MTDTTFVPQETRLVSPWLQDVNDFVYGLRGTTYDQTAAELAAGVTPANMWYPPGDIRRYAGFQDAIDSGSVVFPAGDYDYAEDFAIPANRTIWVQKGATVTNTGGRFSAYDVSNVNWRIDGWVKSVAMATDYVAVPGWPAIPMSDYYERGFLEFGGSNPNGVAAENYSVTGTGKVSADWVPGTPNYSDSSFQTNRKGIAFFNTRHVRVEGLEVFGFDGEAIYVYGGDITHIDWVFRNNYVHDSRFNALNFHAGTNAGQGSIIEGNTTRNVFCCVEASVGSVINNHSYGTVGYGMWTGAGTGNGPFRFLGNIVENAGVSSYALTFNGAGTVQVAMFHGNLSINPAQYALYARHLDVISVKDNMSIGAGTSVGAYDYGFDDCSSVFVSDNLGGITPGAFRVGLFEFSVGCTTCSHAGNIDFSASSGAIQFAGGAPTIASAAAITIPYDQEMVFVSGTTNITSIVATSREGARVCLVFEGILTVTDGSNLKLAGNFVTSVNATLSLVCNGANWYETGRSTNG